MAPLLASNPNNVVERWTPFIEIYDKREAPSHPPFALDLFGDKAIHGAKNWPGQLQNIRFLDLDNNAFLYQDALPGQSPFKPRTLALDYQLVFRDAGASRWIPVHTPRELEERREAREHFAAIVEELAKKDKPTDDELRQLAGAKDTLATLQMSGNGFLNTFYNLYDTRAEGIVWDLPVANVPIDLISKDSIGQDRSVSLRILRGEPLDEQGERHDLIFNFTNGPTRYALVFGRNNSVRWLHYRNMPVGRRAKLEEQLQTLDDTGRLTGENNEQLRQWLEDIEAIKEKAKTQGRANSELDSGEEAAIDAIKAQMDELKTSKRGLTPQDERNRSEILKQLFYDVANVNLQEDTKSLYNRVFDVTIRWLRKGQVQIQLDKNAPWTWTNGAIAKLRGYNQMLPRDARIIIHSDGGPWGVAVGRPKYKSRGLLLTADFIPGFDLRFEETRWEFDADFVTRTTDPATGLFTGVGPFGTRVEASVVVITPSSTKGGIIKPARYQLRVELFSDEDGLYTPEIHHLFFRSLAGDVPPVGERVWTNLPSGVANARQRVQDLISQDAEDKSPYFEAVIDNKFGEQEWETNTGGMLPQDMQEREVKVRLLRVSTGEEFTMIGSGIIKRAEHKNRGLLELLGGLLRFRARPRSKTHLHMIGVEELLNREIKHPIQGNGKLPNDYIRELCQNAGLRPEEFADVPAGDVGIPRIKPPVAGEAPDVTANTSSRYWEYIQEITEKHCFGWRLLIRESGLVLEPERVRDRPDMDYRTTRKPWDMLHVKKGLEYVQDSSEYYTEAVFVGAVDPQTGRRWSASKTIPQATDKRFKNSLYYVGTPRVYNAPPDDTLTDYEACVLACRQYMDKMGRPPWYAMMSVPYNPSVKCGDLIRLDGFRVVVENINRGNLKAGSGTTPTMQITARFYDDVNVAALAMAA